MICDHTVIIAVEYEASELCLAKGWTMIRQMRQVRLHCKEFSLSRQITIQMILLWNSYRRRSILGILSHKSLLQWPEDDKLDDRFSDANLIKSCMETSCGDCLLGQESLRRHLLRSLWRDRLLKESLLVGSSSRREVLAASTGAY